MLLDLIFPKHCVECGRFGAYLCHICARDLKAFRSYGLSVCPVCDNPTREGRTHEVCRSPEKMDGFVPIVRYAEPASTLMQEVKYNGVRDAAKDVYQIMKLGWPSYAPVFEVLVPIPLHPARMRERGFNQAELLAKQLGKDKLIPVSSRALVKVRHTKQQAKLKKEERKLLQQPFVCLHPKDVLGKLVGLVDDVATTRTTLAFACEALKKAGAREVWGVVFAHGWG